MLIFNRWGEQVFESNEYKLGWEVLGSVVEIDTFVWTIDFEYTTDTGHLVSDRKVGVVSVIR